MTDLLSIRGLRAGYGPTVVLEDVGFDVPAGSRLAVLGRNGVGKTTLLATMMGRTTRHAGTIAFKGKPIDGSTTYQRARLGIGYVPQGREIFPSLSVEENLAIAAVPGRWTVARVYDLFPSLASRRGNMGNQLSGGEQQMLAIGRALMTSPSLLLLDEPLEGLAPVIVDQLYTVIERLISEEDMAVILVEQSVKRALELTREVIVLNRGRISWTGTSATLLADRELLESMFVDKHVVGP